MHNYWFIIIVTNERIDTRQEGFRKKFEILNLCIFLNDFFFIIIRNKEVTL